MLQSENATLFMGDAHFCKQYVQLVQNFTKTKESLHAQEKDLRDKMCIGEAKALPCYNMRAEGGILHCVYRYNEHTKTCPCIFYIHAVCQEQPITPRRLCGTSRHDTPQTSASICNTISKAVSQKA